MLPLVGAGQGGGMKCGRQAVAVVLCCALGSFVAGLANALGGPSPFPARLSPDIQKLNQFWDGEVHRDRLHGRIDRRMLFAQLDPVSSGLVAQNSVASLHPVLGPYDDFVRQSIEPGNVRYWQIFDAGPGREPLIAYCQKDLTAKGAMTGKRVRVRPGSSAGELFPQITGEVGQLLGSAELNTALQLGILDCLGFGGEPVASTASSEPSVFDAETVDSVARTLGAVATDEIFAWDRGNLEWAIYRATNGDLNEIYNLYAAFRNHGAYKNSPQFTLMAGYWAVRAIEFAPRVDDLQYRELVEAAAGNCEEHVELCKGIQIELRRIGQYSGAIDGIIGRGTSRAIEAITGTRLEGSLASLVTFKEFLVARQPAQRRGEPTGDPTPAESDAGAVLALPDNLDDF